MKEFTNNQIIIISGVVVLIVSIICIIIIFASLNNKYPQFKYNLSSCNKNSSCNVQYNITETAQPVKDSYCKNMVSCNLKDSDQFTYDSYDFDIVKSQQQTNLSNIGCFTINDIKICCKGFLPICASMQYLLNINDYNTYSGQTVLFSDTLCKFLPSCFANNNSSPYLLFPVPEFGTSLFTETSEAKYNVDVVANDLITPTNVGFSTLGATVLSDKQAIVFALQLPPLKYITYFSLTPYIFSTSRMGSNFSNGILFSSITDPFNLFDIQNILTDQQKANWQDNPITILVISTHNKNIAEDFCNNIKKPKFQSSPSGFISEIEKEYNISGAELENTPVICVPIPAGSTFGNTIDPLGRNMLKKYRTNKYINASSPIFDYQKDTFLLLGRIVPSDDYSDEFETWKNETASQSKSVVLGIEKDLPYKAFKLSEQNGYFNKNKNDEWKWTTYKVGNWIGSNFKKQISFTTNTDRTDLIEYKNNIINELQNTGDFSEVYNVDTVQLPSPFYQYNDYIQSVASNQSMNNLLWSQIGIDMIQYNVATFGDCRDTIYPASGMFCLGMNDLAVVLSQNYMSYNDSKKDSNILYNTLNLYDTQTVTSFGSLKGDGLGKNYSIGFSRSDLSHLSDITSIDSIEFIPSGPHNILAASEDTSFISMNRVYLNVPTETIDGLIFATSPSPLDLVEYTTVICKSCKNLNTTFADVGPAGTENLVEDTNDKIKKNDLAQAAVCSKLRNPKNKDQTAVLIVFAIAISISITIIPTMIYIGYINDWGRNADSPTDLRCKIYLIFGGAVILTCLCLFAKALSIWKNRIKGVPASTYNVTIEQA